MKYYISRTHVNLDAAGRLSGYETVLTRPDTLRATQTALKRYTALGITDLHLCEHPNGSRRWGRLDREAAKRRKDRPMTVADVAEDLAELDKEARACEEDI